MKIDTVGAAVPGSHNANIGIQNPNTKSRAAKTSGKLGPIVVVDHRAFFRDCVTKALAAGYGLNVEAISRAENLAESAQNAPPSLILLFVSNDAMDAQIASLVAALEKSANIPPFVVFSEDEDLDDIIGALEKGARGYITSTTPLDVVVEALRLVAAGGTFVPASSVIAAQRNGEGYRNTANRSIADGVFTPRQSAIIAKLRIGKSNKIIAYELSMCESTVKVHVRNIMKKLNAKNRTEVAFLASRQAR